MDLFRKENGKLIYHYDAEEVILEPWGENSLRVRGFKTGKLKERNWALLEQEYIETQITMDESGAIIKNGAITAKITRKGKLLFYNSRGELILEEYARNRRDLQDPKCSAIEVEAREFKPIPGGDYHLTVRFETIDQDERIYGMGQYQQPYLNLMGTDLELAHRNSQASVPFALSSLGYGLLWNNPGIGRVVFGKNIKSFEAYSTDILDYWITVGDTPAEIEEAYAKVTGTVPMMPEYGLGFWQCKLRYQTQEELLEIAREYKRRGLPLDLIVIDFFHWPKQGEWKFDPVYWPDPDAMVEELKELSVKLMVSIWPTVDRESENYEEMLEKGYLIRTDRGFRVGLNFQGATIHYDATNPEARDYVWNKVKENYYEKGVQVFWLDEAEPEYTAYDFDNYRYYQGSNLQIGNIYPVEYAKTFYEGMKAQGQENIVNLIRCAWAGSQKYGALVWSGDIASSFESMKNQLAAGLNMGIAGIPWWTTDIGGFHGGDPDDEAFRELFVRWFQWGTFCPVMRLHGDREPRRPQVGTTGGATCCSGAANEVWSYGEKVYEICKDNLELRESLRPYTKGLMKEAHEKGTPVMRPLFYEFPEDKVCWEVEDQYLYGPDYLVAPILETGMRSRKVYFPKGFYWKEIHSGINYQGGSSEVVDSPLEYMPVFFKEEVIV
ncbi:glycoside hydrolase family 31 protein [Lacrimispora algidixylanolytica]|uniref:Family 31 glucosidase n=1 Tax=Lacrimispora algidixylanolytica TaxID=94868 RepID=A0A419SYC6_9FIRM|nr:TIM-barrel domain-containing protein [Lacrimispora algidixylanolytica]RKD30206.1 family 31 glucosidase [Lacrimispora algidixylanolytica]